MAAVALLGLAAAEPVLASRPSDALSPGRTYVAARAAALSGDHGRSAQLLASLVESDAAGQAIAREAVSEAISAGDMPLAFRLIKDLPHAALPVEARLLLAADAIKDGHSIPAAEALGADSDGPELGFLNPFILAWHWADRGDATRAVAAMSVIQEGSPLARARDEHLALVLLKLRRPTEADAYVERALALAGGREQRLRLAFADGFLKAGDRQRAARMLEGLSIDSARAGDRIRAGRPSGLAVDSPAKAFSELMQRLAVELSQLNNRGMPVGIAQIARFVAPDNDSATLMLAALLESRERTDDALAALRQIGPQSGLGPQARDLEVQALIEAGRGEQALRIAHAAAADRDAGASDHGRLADTLSALERHDEAAAAYARALALARGASAEQRWPLLLLQASALEAADRWSEAKAALNAALALAPEQPLILNFLGYAKLERGEDLDLAEAMIRKANALAPDDASITDSLGWALYKRGRHDQAIEVLQRAARTDPGQAEIHEHLGDALYRVGRKYEARFAWTAALTTAEDDMARRVRAKIDSGLTAETAAP